MPDIRLAHERQTRLWLWVGVLAALGLGLWSTAFFFGDATDPDERPKVGAQLDIGEDRTPVLPAQAVPFHAMTPVETRDLGRLVRLSGVAQSPVRSNAVWVRSAGGRRILVRFEPPPPAEALRGIGSGSRIEVEGYLEKISRAEFSAWMDTLGVRVPQPPPGRKFGDLPDPGFARVDSLFIKTYYISVRPEGLDPAEPGGEMGTPPASEARAPAEARPGATG